MFSDEANAELTEYINSKSQYITLEGVNGRRPDGEAIQSMYNMTLVLPEDQEKMTKNISFA